MTEAHARRWLALIGIGEDGLDGLSSAARLLLSQAELVVGGARHLALAGPLQCKTLVWPSPPTEALAPILSWRGRPVCVLASGDPFFYGIGALLMNHLAAGEMLCLPATSAFSLAAARLGWPLQDCSLVSLHGRELERIFPHFQPGARVLALSWDGTTPQRLAFALTERGLGASRITVLEAMGGPHERISVAVAKEWTVRDVAALNTVGLEIVADRGARLIPLASGLPDSLFESDGQITKREVRAMTLSALEPLRGQMLWDVGAGSGSIGIEWMLRDPSNRAISIEQKSERAARIGRNALLLGVPGLRIVQCQAPDAFYDLPQPDAIFLGGGATDPGVMDAVWAALRPGGRLVVNAVTLETQVEIVQGHSRRGGELVCVQIARAEPVGSYFGWRPAMPVTQWRVIKP